MSHEYEDESERGYDRGERRRKERILHTRISEDLAEDLRRVAEELRVPVSNLVRNVLEDVFSVVEVVSDNVGDLVEEVVDEADRVAERLARRTRSAARSFDAEARRDEAVRDPELEFDEPGHDEPEAPARPDLPEFPDVVGWQPLVLNAAQTCACCGRGLVRGDRAALQRLVGNLLANAVLYGQSGTDVEVALASGAGEAELEVRDRGPGIPAADRGRIFERFVRLPSARSRNPEGSGLGLAIVEQVARAHGGRIEVDDRPGGGSVFRAVLPTGR